MTEEVVIPHANRNRYDQPKGSWCRVGYDGDLYVIRLKCAECGQCSVLSKSPAFGNPGHEIRADGAVRPSIVCPVKGCTWHIWGRLEDWGTVMEDTLPLGPR